MEKSVIFIDIYKIFPSIEPGTKPKTMEGKVNVVVLAPKGSPAGTDKIVDLMKTHSNLNVVVGASAEELGAEVCLKADGLILWWAFRDAAQAFWRLAEPETRGRLRWVHSTFAGIDAMLFPELVASEKVTMTLTRGVFSNSLAEWVTMAMLYLGKDVPRLIANKHAHKYEKYVVTEVKGQTMLVVGYGDIGRACGRKAHDLGLHVIGVRTHPEATSSDGVAEKVVGIDSLLEVLPEADYVTLVLPLTPKTRGIFGREAFAAMKPSAYFINIGRGATVDDDAFLEALREKKIAGAALDVFSTEPLPPENPLWDVENVLMSPHCADATKTYTIEAGDLAVTEVARFAEGLPLLHIADKKAGY